MQAVELLFFLALGLYSLVIWTHKFRGVLGPWMISTFGIALLADIAGTVFLCVVAAPGRTLTVHGVIGFLSLLIMALHFLWAFMASARGGRSAQYFKRYSVCAWCLWLTAFVSGLVL